MPSHHQHHQQHHHRNNDGTNDYAEASVQVNNTSNNDMIITTTHNILPVVRTTNQEAVSKVFEMNELIALMVQFVGPNQFLFVASIHPLFRYIYTKSFGVMTQCNIISMSINHAMICFRAGQIPQQYLSTLWTLAVRQNMLRVLYHLRYVYGFTDLSLASFMLAVQYGHLEILQWLVSISSISSSGTTIIFSSLYNDEVACSMAARMGHIPILKYLYTYRK